jgi:probable F420-dependent oxidoreductase
LTLPVLRDPSARHPFAQTYELARLAEQHGFDTATIGHHHFLPGNLADPLTFLAAVAARTDTLRVGTGIFQLPIHHPVRVAEQVATIDQLSGGRVSLGVGLGWWPLEYQVHGSDFRERGARLEEALQILRLVWGEEETAFDGRFWSFPSLTVHPRPVQRPRPPLWVAGVADTAIDRAARLGDAWLCGPVQTITKVASMVDTYRAACARHGTDPAWILRRFTWIAPTRAEVVDGALAAYVHGLVEHWKESVEDDEDQALYARFDAGEVTIEDLADQRLLWGTPEDAIAQIERYRAVTGADDIHAAFGAGLPGSGPQASMGDFETIATQIRLFGEEVIPAFR